MINMLISLVNQKKMGGKTKCFIKKMCLYPIIIQDYKKWNSNR